MFICVSVCMCVCQSSPVLCVAGILAAVRLRDSQRKPVLVQFTVNDSLPALHSPAGHWPTRFVCTVYVLVGLVLRVAWWEGERLSCE